MAIRTAIYARVSSDRQVQAGESIQAQLDALRSYVTAHSGMVLTGEYVDDGISGTKFTERDELQRLLTDVVNGKIDLILFTKLDRWFRSIRHYIRTQEVLDKYGVGWKAIWESLETTTPQGRLMVSQLMAFAQFEAENTGLRIKAVFDYKISKGEVVTGNTPYGYSIEGKRLVPDHNAETVRSIFEHYSMTGNLHGTSRYSASLGCVTSTNGLKQMLKNKKYIGEYRGNTRYCDPIIERSLFDDVQRKLSINIKSNQKHIYIYSGLVKCAECGASMGANRRVRKRGNCTTVEVTYRCPAHYQRGDRRCPNTKTLNEKTLERYLLDNVRPLMESHITEYEILQKPMKEAEAQRKTITSKLERLKRLYIDGLIEIDEYKMDKLRLEEELSQLTEEEPEKDLSELKSLLSLDISGIYATFSKEEKRYFWRAVIKEIRYGMEKKIKVIFM